MSFLIQLSHSLHVVKEIHYLQNEGIGKKTPFFLEKCKVSARPYFVIAFFSLPVYPGNAIDGFDF